MPLLRYFVYVGGALLALLLVSNVVLPQAPLPGTLTSATDLPPVRIHSDRKLPDRVVFDTSPTVSQVPVPVLTAPATAARSVAPVPAAPTVAEISPKARVREAFAQIPDDQVVVKPKIGQMALVTVSEPKLISKSLPKRRLAKPRTASPMAMVAQQPHFGQ